MALDPLADALRRGGDIARRGASSATASPIRTTCDILILHRGERAFVIMNLYPYNTGHLMIVPNAPRGLSGGCRAEVMREMAELAGRCCVQFAARLSPDGFNLGLNVGAVAGAEWPTICTSTSSRAGRRRQLHADPGRDDGYAGADPGDVCQDSRATSRRAGIQQSGNNSRDRR